MKKWSQQIESQRRRYRERVRNSDGSRAGGTSVTEFSYMQSQSGLVNPYSDMGDEEDDADTLVGSGGASWQGYPNKIGSDFTESRNGSSTSLRSRSTTGESSMSTISGRPRPPRLTSASMQSQPGLTLRTRELQQSQSDLTEESYFSPTVESPLSSSRTSSSSNLYPFPRQNMPQNGYYEEGHGATRFTAPAMPRHPSQTNANGYKNSASRPSFPAGMHSSSSVTTARNRSASSPDIHNGQRVPLRSNGGQPPVPDMPAPYQHLSHAIPRSQSNSPNLPNGMTRGNTVAQAQPHARYQQRQHSQDTSASGMTFDGRQFTTSRTVTPISTHGPGSFSPPPSATSTTGDMQTPTQLKVKVHCPMASQVLTLVVPLNISYQSLKDRIDAKLQRSTNLSLSDKGPKESQVKLKYLDEDDYVSIQSDEDVQTAFETWREQVGETGPLGGMGEIELFCQR